MNESKKAYISLFAAQDQTELRAMTPLLSFCNVSFGFGEPDLIRSVIFDLQAGSCTALIGVQVPIPAAFTATPPCFSSGPVPPLVGLRK